MKRFVPLVRILYPLSLAGITLLSLIPVLPQPQLGINFLDKIEHGVAYAATGALGAYYFRGTRRGRLGASVLSILVGMALGVAVEFIQSFVGRSGELADGLADLAGLASGAGFVLFAGKSRY